MKLTILAKEIWEKLEIAHEGTNQVKENKISMLPDSPIHFFDELRWVALLLLMENFLKGISYDESVLACWILDLH